MDTIGGELNFPRLKPNSILDNLVRLSKTQAKFSFGRSCAGQSCARRSCGIKIVKKGFWVGDARTVCVTAFIAR